MAAWCVRARHSTAEFIEFHRRLMFFHFESRRATRMPSITSRFVFSVQKTFTLLLDCSERSKQFLFLVGTARPTTHIRRTPFT